LIRIENDHDEGKSLLPPGIEAEFNKTTENVGRALSPLKNTTPGRSWYKAMHDAGYNFGLLFQKHLEVESVPGMRRSRSLVSLTEPPSECTQSAYPMHPACIDGCFQSVAPSLWKGDRSSINAVLVPAIVDTIVLKSSSMRAKVGISETTSEYIGVGRPEEAKNYMSHGSVHNPETVALIFTLSELRYHKLDTRADRNAAHTYTRVAYKPDITYLSQEHLLRLTTKSDRSQSLTVINEIIELKAFKKPNLKVMEVSLSPTDSSSLWFQEDSFDKSSEEAYRKYCYALKDATALVEVQGKYESHPNTSFVLLDLTKTPHDFKPSKTDFDLVNIKLSTSSEEVLANVAQSARGVLCNGGHFLLVRQGEHSADAESDDIVVVKDKSTSDQTHLEKVMSASRLYDILELPCEQQSSDPAIQSACLAVAHNQGLEAPSSDHSTNIVYLSKNTQINSTLKEALQALRWQVMEHTLPLTSLLPKGTVLILDELCSPILTNVAKDQWQAIKHLISLESKILWVIEGSQMNVTKPENALVQRIFPNYTRRRSEPETDDSGCGVCIRP
jgi:Polyketide synthase dehydratase